MLGWLRRRFVTGFFVTVPLVVSVVAIVWMFRFADRLTERAGRAVDRPARARGWGSSRRRSIVLVVGVAGAATSSARRLLQRGEQLLLHVPVFRTIYAPVKQLMNAFSPDNESGFKRWCWSKGQRGGRVRARVSDAGVHGRSRAGPGDAAGGVRADESISISVT